jgi:phosphoglycolate phosphatase
MKNILIFDYDGVIVDSFHIFMDNFMYACKKEGGEHIATKDDFLKLFENNMYESMFAMGMTKEEILRIVYHMRDALIRNQNKIKPFKGISHVLEVLSKTNMLFIVTSNESEVVEKYLKTQNLFGFFKEIYGSDKSVSKIEKILEIKDKNPGCNYFYIGDTQGDIIEGKKSGVKVIAVTWGWHEKNKLKKVTPDFIVDYPKNIEKILK